MATTLAQKESIRQLLHKNYKAAAIAEELNITLRTTRKWMQRIKKGTYLRRHGAALLVAY